MSINSRIYLNSHAKPKDIMYVILKSIGHEFIYRKNHIKETINHLEPSSEFNSWKIQPSKGEFEIKLSDVNYFQLVFNDPCNQSYETLLHLNIEDDCHSYNNEKLLNPINNEIWLCIGKKLVDFFGGKLLYSDSVDDTDSKNWYIKKNGSFPKKNKNQSGDERWYQFQNCLNNVKPITKLEIENMSEYSAYKNDKRIYNLKYYLDKLELASELNQDLVKNVTKTKLKLKV